VVGRLQTLIRTIATAIGVMTGAGTIVGWVVSTKSPSVVLGTALGYAGMAVLGFVTLACFVAAILPPSALQALEEKELTKATLKARAFYLGASVVMAAIAASTGIDPLAGFWIALGAVTLGMTGYSAFLVSRRAAAERKREQRVCPDCAETIKAKACLCRFCGYRFSLPPTAYEFALESKQAEVAEPAVPAPATVPAAEAQPAGPA
jgi:hypothetical protein